MRITALFSILQVLINLKMQTVLMSNTIHFTLQINSSQAKSHFKSLYIILWVSMIETINHNKSRCKWLQERPNCRFSGSQYKVCKNWSKNHAKSSISLLSSVMAPFPQSPESNQTALRLSSIFQRAKSIKETCNIKKLTYSILSHQTPTTLSENICS